MSELLEDPERLAEAADDALLRDLLEAGRDELADAEQLSAVAAKLGPILAAGSGAAAGAAGTAKAASALGGGAVAKLLGVVGVGTLIAVAALQLVKPSSSGLDTPWLASAPPGSSATSAPALPVVEVAPSSAETQPSAALGSTNAPSPDPSAPRRHASSAPVESASPAEPVKPDSEAKVLKRAQDALRADPARALAICDEHRRSFPRGLLGQEREVITIGALMRLGRSGEAETRARRFAALHPSSTHLRRIETLLGKSLQENTQP